MVTINSSGQDYQNNTDGFTLGGGTTERKLTLTGGNVNITGTNNNYTFTFPGITDTLVGMISSQTLTNKDLTSTTNTLPTASTTTLGAVKVDGSTITISSGVISSAGSSGGMSTSTYDPAGIAQQVVGTTAAQTLTNKNLTSGNTFPIFNQSTTGTAANVTGIVAVGNGGTGATTFTGILKGNGTSAVTAVTAPTGAIVGTSDVQTLTNKNLTSGNTFPIFNQSTTGTAANVTGVVAVGNGGTGTTTFTGILKGNGTSAVTAVTAPTGVIVGTSDVQTLTNKTITSMSAGSSRITSVSDPISSTDAANKSYVDTMVSGSTFRQYRASTGNVAPASGSNLFGNYFFDTNNYVSADLTSAPGSANKITVSIAGTYMVTIGILLNTYVYSGIIWNAVLYKNGSVVSWGPPCLEEYSGPGFGGVFTMKCNANDYLQPGYNSSATDATYFTGESTGARAYWTVTLITR